MVCQTNHHVLDAGPAVGWGWGGGEDVGGGGERTRGGGAIDQGFTDLLCFFQL